MDEVVTLTCNIENGGGVQNWRYRWNKEGSDQTVSNDHQYSIYVEVADAGKYTCTGTETGSSRSSHPSDAVLLTVSVKPKPTVRLEPQSFIYTGDTVTLTCDLNQSTGWTFIWYRNDQEVNSQISADKITTNKLSEKLSNTGTTKYKCRAQRENNYHNKYYYYNYNSLHSDPVTVTVEGESSSVSLIISPSRTQHFTDESLSLSCVDQSKSTEWRVRRYTDDRGVLDCSTVLGTYRRCHISSLNTSHTGVYWCESESGGSSNPVNITVHDGDVILESPVHPVTEGESLTLHCLYRKTKPSNLRADFCKDGSVVQNQTSGEMMIHHVLKSDEGFYHCKYIEGGESPKSWVIIRVSEASLSVLKMISSAVAASPYLLSTIILVKCYRARGEIVTLTCNINNGGGVQNWRYSWNKGGSDQTVSNDQQYRISDVTENHAGKYTCTGTETGGSRSSHPSDAVLLTVSAKPKPTVRLEPQNFIYTGDTVTLTCDLNQSTGWTFFWYRNDQSVNPQISADKITTNKLSEKLYYTGTTKYKCRAQRGNYYSYYYSQYSDPVTVTVEERPKAAVIINPDNHVFRGETVTLTCNIVNGGGVQNWRYSWNKGGSDQTVSNDQQYRISDVTENHAGKYTCTGTETGGSRSSHPSDAVLLTVSAKPKPTVRLEPQNFIYTGDTVTLTCDLNQSTGWTFLWYRNDQSVNPQISVDKITTNKLREKLSNTGTTKYKCRAQRGNYYSYYYSQYSDPVTVTVEERPKPTVTINPDNHVFIGEIVTLTCNIENGGGVQNWSSVAFISRFWMEFRETKPKPTVRLEPQNFIYTGDTVTLTCDLNQSTGWTFFWYRNDQPVNPQISADKITTNKLSEKLSNTGTTKYKCRAQRGNYYYSYYYSQYSDPVTVTVEERPKPTVIINPDNHVFIGERVTLTCNIENRGGVQNWRYSWNKEGSDQTVSNDQQYRIQYVTENHAGKYTCTGTETGGSRSSHPSDAVLLTVSGESSSVSLTISPSRTQHFTDESLSLSCVDQSKSTEWRVRRYTDDQGVLDCSSVSGTVGESTCNISSLSTSHTGVYWCESESGGSSNPVNITVHDGDVILESPVHPVTEGESLTLHCLYRKTKPSNLRADFYKDGLVVQNQTSGEMMIHQVSKSDDGFYHCKYPERGESPKSWVIIRVSKSVATIIGVAVGLSSALLLLVLILLWRYKKNKGAGDIYANTHVLTNQSRGKISVGADTVYSELKQNTD
ncbi:Fc receptor-like protein 5 [Trichomycterus rosablanca]|uniref:Fc receptor-like protein 5 n=1 Tax=Trichomycterus rosablanca TaxID=2290929 RepID=UPI002F35D35C